MKITTMFKSLVVISALGLFSSLGAYSLGKYGIYENTEHGYTAEERAGMDALVERLLAESVSDMTPEEQLLWLYGG